MTSNEIRLYDTLNEKFFIVLPGKSLRIYICGPTVYTHTHIGHLKTYMTFDIIRRVLEDYFKIPVRLMMNITNVDDKIIRATYQKEYNLPDDFNLNELKELQYLNNQKFIDYANYWENNFFRIMDQMNIKKPNIISRVTEYIEEIFEFVEQIDKKGFAFHNNGSVYFYGTKYNNISETNGSFSTDPSNEHNFVLLKRAQDYAPSWESRYKTRVRPGWHIECSAMAKSVYGNHFDIHAGGIDLKFPHHHNEMQQSNCICKQTQTDPEWVDHFMHQGHLNIEGLKMSRSLKNFISVEEIAKTHSANKLRYLFLLHGWADPMDYSEHTLRDAEYFDDYFKNLMIQTQSILLRKTTIMHKKFSDHEIKYSQLLDDTKISIDSELRNNINTLNCIKILHELGSQMFIYVKTVEGLNLIVSSELLSDTLEYIKSILCVFGLTFDKVSTNDDKLLGVISDIRTNIRIIAKDIGNKVKQLDKNLAREVTQTLYELTDRIRDKDLPAIGIQLTDK